MGIFRATRPFSQYPVRLLKQTSSKAAANYGFQGVAWAILECARRTGTFRACAFREQEDAQATPPPFFSSR